MTKGVTKRFGNFVAVNKVDFELQENETLGIIGPNGAGKTTFINLLTGYYTPDHGQVFYRGEDITHLSPAKRVKIGILRTFQLVHVFDNLSVLENLGLAYFRKKEDKPLSMRMYFTSVRRPEIASKTKEAMEMMELGHLRNEIAANLSLGSKKRLELAMSFVSDPKVVVFDEPFSGLGDHEIDEGGLPRAVGPDNTQRLFLLQFEINLVHGYKLPEPLRDPLGHQDWLIVHVTYL